VTKPPIRLNKRFTASIQKSPAVGGWTYVVTTARTSYPSKRISGHNSIRRLATRLPSGSPNGSNVDWCRM